MPVCPMCHQWLARGMLVAPRGAPNGAPRDRCPRDGALVALRAALPTPPPSRHPPRRDALPRPRLFPDLAIIGCLFFGVAAASVPWVGVVAVAAMLGVAWWTGGWVIALLGIVFGIAWLGAGLLISLYKV